MSLLDNIKVCPAPWCDGGNECTTEDAGFDFERDVLRYNEKFVWTLETIKSVLSEIQYDFLELLFVNAHWFTNCDGKRVFCKIQDLNVPECDEFMSYDDFFDVHWNCNSVYSDGTAEMTLNGCDWFILKVK